MPNNQNELAVIMKPPSHEKASTSDLRKASKELKAKIAEARSRNDMPLNSALGNPKWEKSAADGHLNAADDED